MTATDIGRDQLSAPLVHRPGPDRRRRISSFLRMLRTAVVAVVMVAVAAVGGTHIARQRIAARAFVHVGSAVLTAEPVPVGAADAGIVAKLLVGERDSVRAGQPVALVSPVAKPATVEVVRAPAAGTVASVDLDVGGLASPGLPVLTLYDRLRLTFRATVPASQLRRLRLGMAATITGTGLRRPVSATLDRVVSRVGPLPVTTSDRLTVVLVPVPADRATVATLVPGVRFTATVDSRTARGRTPAVSSMR